MILFCAVQLACIRPAESHAPGAGAQFLSQIVAKKLDPGVDQSAVLQVDAVLLGLPVSSLPGVGWALQKRLTELKLDSVAQLRSAGRARLQRELGDKVMPTAHAYRLTFSPRGFAYLLVASGGPPPC